MAARRSLVFLSLIVLLALAQSPGAVQQTTPQSTFRAGVNYVRADVYVTRNDAFVADLTQDDFELVEDGVPQRIEKFEVITASSRTGDVLSTPRTLAESRTLVETARGRLFVVFLDTFHVDFAESTRLREPLARFLNRAIGADDLVAVMTPDMSAADLTFERRGESADGVLARRWPWGVADAVLTKDPIDDRYQMCYPGQAVKPDPGCASDVGIAAEMIARRHEKHTLDAFDDLIGELETLRDERKSIVTLSRGWLLYRPDDVLARPVNCRTPPPPPAFKPPPTGLAPTASQATIGGDTSSCEGDRRALSALDNARQFRDMTDRANRANVTFYALDPRGAAAFDRPISQPMISPSAERALVERRQGTLRDLASSTDGVAMLNQNSLDGGFSRIARDVSGYYLLGYSSTGKLDGKFHNIRVRVKRPGLDVRARRGFLAPTQAELSRATAPGQSTASAAPVPTAAIAAAAMSGLARAVRDAPLRLASSTSGAAGSPSVWIQGELDPQLRPSEADVSIVLTDSSGTILASKREHLAKEARSFRSALTPTAAPAGGEYVARVRLQSATGDWDTVTATDAVPISVAGVPSGVLFSRRGASTANRVVPAADRRFRRSEQLIAELPLAASAPLSAHLLDRNGAPMPVPVTMTERRDEAGVVWQAAQVSLSALAPGDYAVELADAAGHSIAAAFRVVP